MAHYFCSYPPPPPPKSCKHLTKKKKKTPNRAVRAIGSEIRISRFLLFLWTHGRFFSLPSMPKLEGMNAFTWSAGHVCRNCCLCDADSDSSLLRNWKLRAQGKLEKSSRLPIPLSLAFPSVWRLDSCYSGQTKPWNNCSALFNFQNV